MQGGAAEGEAEAYLVAPTTGALERKSLETPATRAMSRRCWMGEVGRDLLERTVGSRGLGLTATDGVLVTDPLWREPDADDGDAATAAGASGLAEAEAGGAA